MIPLGREGGTRCARAIASLESSDVRNEETLRSGLRRHPRRLPSNRRSARRSGSLPPVFLALTLLLLLVAGCATAPRGPAAGSVAVWELDDLGAGGSQSGLGEALSGPVIEVLRAEGYPVVERQRLTALLEELKLASSGLADESTRLRLGRLSGARRMVFGAYQSYGGQVRVDLRLVDVETGKVVRAAQRTAPAGDLLAALEAARGAARTLVKNSP